MNLADESMRSSAIQSAQAGLRRNASAIASDLLPLCDFLSLLLAAPLGTLLYAHVLAAPGLAPGFGGAFEPVAWMAAILAPFILYDARFGAVASRGQTSVLVRSHALRFALFAGVVLVLGGLGPVLAHVPPGWLTTWFAAGLLLTALARVLVARTMRRLQRRGVLTEVVAVVGAGPVADRLVQTLRQARADSIELLGIFDDKIVGAVPGTIKPSGTLAQLIELGKTRRIDWILLTLPATAEQRVMSIVQRLKALSVSIGLCPQHVGLAVPYRTIDYVGDNVPVSLLADRPIKRWEAVIKGGEDYLPRWTVTLMLLLQLAIVALATRLVRLVPVSPRRYTGKLTFQFDNFDVTQFTGEAASFGQNHYGYAVTPNADHLIRLHEHASFRALYADASYVLLDSRFLSHLLRLTKGIQLPVCTGSDLTAKLFSDVISPNDPLVLIGGSDKQARQLSERYGLRCLAHFNPPMGFIHDPAAVEACLRFVEAHSPFRFCLLAVGAPQQEAIAQHLKVRGVARGLALCIGASINFLTGDERRAPLWMQHCGTEWLFRLMQAPGRMARRYLVRGPRVFGLLRRAEIVLRKNLTSLPQLAPAPGKPVILAKSTAESTHLPLVVVSNHPVPDTAPSSKPVRRPEHPALVVRENRSFTASS